MGKEVRGSFKCKEIELDEEFFFRKFLLYRRLVVVYESDEE